MNTKNILATLGYDATAAALGFLTNSIATDNKFYIKDSVTATAVGVAAIGLAYQGIMQCYEVSTHPNLTGLAGMLKMGAASWFGYVFADNCDNKMSCLTEGHPDMGQLQAIIALCLAAIVLLVEAGAQLACPRSKYSLITNP